MSTPTNVSERAKDLTDLYFAAWRGLIAAGIGSGRDTAIVLRALANTAQYSDDKNLFDSETTVGDLIQREIDALERATVTSPPTHDTAEPITTT